MENELQTLQMAKNLASLCLNQYRTTIEEDEAYYNKLLQEGEGEEEVENRKNCLLIVIGEKKILHSLLLFSEKIMTLLEIKLHSILGEIIKDYQYQVKNHGSLLGL